MWEIIRNLTKKGTTVFLTTQYLEEADQLANRIAILHEGRIVTKGTPSQLKSLITGRSMELKFDNSAALKAATKLLKDSFDITVDEVETALNVITNGSASQAMQILNALQKNNITVDEFSQKQPSLDDVFLSIVDNKNKEQA
jgi:ABC-2 type transport system ATP-binding protein